MVFKLSNHHHVEEALHQWWQGFDINEVGFDFLKLLKSLSNRVEQVTLPSLWRASKQVDVVIEGINQRDDKYLMQAIIIYLIKYLTFGIKKPRENAP